MSPTYLKLTCCSDAGYSWPGPSVSAGGVVQVICIASAPPPRPPFMPLSLSSLGLCTIPLARAFCTGTDPLGWSAHARVHGYLMYL
eukprot:5331359-Pyramimonas_sp.AAC.1